MTTLFIDKRDLQLKADGDALAFYQRDSGEKVGTVPIRLLERVCIHGDLQLCASVLGKLGEHGVGVVVLSGRKQTPVLMMPAAKVDAARRQAQYQAAQDPHFCIGQAKQWLNAKISGQLALIEQHTERHPALHATADTLRRLLLQVSDCLNLERLRGFEGTASARYFAVWQSILPASLNFSGRNRRPPQDPFNAVLSLTYTLMHFELVRTIHLCGLDPFIGFFHTVSHGRESLACDLLEPLRPACDQWAYQLFAQKILRPEDFGSQSGACLIGKAGRIRFYSNFEPFLEQQQPTCRELCHTLLHDLAAHAADDHADFEFDVQHWSETA